MDRSLKCVSTAVNRLAAVSFCDRFRLFKKSSLGPSRNLRPSVIHCVHLVISIGSIDRSAASIERRARAIVSTVAGTDLPCSICSASPFIALAEGSEQPPVRGARGSMFRPSLDPRGLAFRR